MKRTKKLIAWLIVIAVLLSGCSTAASAQEQNVRGALADEIAAALAAQEPPSEWMIFDLAAYGAEISEEKRAAYIESAVGAVAKETALVTDFVKAEIILRALGVDTTAIEGVSIPEKIHAIEEFTTYSDAVWILIADSLDSVTLTEAQICTAVAKISENTSESGLLLGSYGGYTYDDPDSTGAAVGALSRFVDDGDFYGANALYEKMLTALSNAQQESGSFGSACTDAFVIVGLCAAGINPETDTRFVKGEKSLVDGLMSYAVEGGFAGYDGSLDLEWSTEQGFRALLALQGFEKQGGAAYNLYFSETDSSSDGGNGEDDGNSADKDEENKEDSVGGGLVAGGDKSDTSDTDTGTDESENTPSGGEPEPETIIVTFEMRTHKKTWISAHTAEVDPNTSVRNLISEVFDKYDVESEGLNMGYLRSVTYNGETWGEFDAGGASGWQYYVNGELPRVGIGSYKLKDGDLVELVYTADYTDTVGDSGQKDTEKSEEEKADIAENKEEAEVWTNPFTDVEESDWFVSAVQFVNEKGLMNGMTELSFVPDGTLTRAMFITVLYRMEDSPEAGEEKFLDVDGSAWYGAAVAWASEKGIVNGTSATAFSPSDPVTREQMATLAYRYAAYKGKTEPTEGELDFTDAGEISEYAREAAVWANASGVMTGINGGFNPAANSKRSEAATVFMRLYNAING